MDHVNRPTIVLHRSRIRDQRSSSLISVALVPAKMGLIPEMTRWRYVDPMKNTDKGDIHDSITHIRSR